MVCTRWHNKWAFWHTVSQKNVSRFSQGSVATCLSCGGIFKEFVAELLPSINSERIFRFCPYLAKLVSKNIAAYF